MNGVAMDTTKVLTEKLSLARELATLKPELEHLRSQATYHQTILSEKLTLQRQISSLEVELEAEKRAGKRAAKNKNENREREAELQIQLDVLQRELAQEKREASKTLKEREAEFQGQLDALQEEVNREKLQASKAIKDLEKQLRASENRRKVLENRAGEETDLSEKESEFQSKIDELQNQLEHEKARASKASTLEKELKATETHQSALEGKVEQLRTKLRTAREQLKEAQNEVTQVRAAANKVRSMPTINEAPAKTPRKRSAPEMSTDVTIGTPDGVAVRGKRPGVKRGRADQTMVGEKSMFSITPFLNRTTSVAPESPIQESPIVEREASAEEMPVPVNIQSNGTTAFPTPVVSSPSGQPKAKSRKKVVEKGVEKNVLGEARPNIRKNKPAPKKLKAMSTLEKVTEEDGDENEHVTTTTSVKENPVTSEARGTNSKTAKLQVKQAVIEESGPKKKKRKLPGATLFDEEDGEAPKRRGQWLILVQIDAKYRIFKKGQTVVDLGYAPGSWSQVAVERTKPSGRIVGIDIIPAQPPKGVSTIQGNFLSSEVREEVKRFLSDPDRGRPKLQETFDISQPIVEPVPSYIDLERHLDDDHTDGKLSPDEEPQDAEKPVVVEKKKSRKAEDREMGRMVDVVLSDMSAPWEQTTGFWKRSLSDPYIRMMNTSGISFKDHAGTLQFAFDTLKTGGHLGESTKKHQSFCCSESKEAYFVALRRKHDVNREDVLGENHIN
ncbi:putative ribosomal RNA methyltransferase MRM2, mitochondrial [Halenospora varia]|nr:putative ribosomal RNA methyltransferase MRM2, mitochondrial [Halenospora varia]